MSHDLTTYRDAATFSADHPVQRDALGDSQPHAPSKCKTPGAADPSIRGMAQCPLAGSLAQRPHWAWVALMGLLLGCSSESTDGGKSPGGTSATSTAASSGGSTARRPEPANADEVLQRMAAAYRQANSYADHGQIRLMFQRDGEKVDEVADFSVALQRPDRFRLQCYQGAMVSDGKTLWASIAELPDQVLVTDAPPQLTLDAIYFEPTLTSVLTEGVAGAAIQMSLLLSDDALDPILADTQPPRLLDPAKVKDRLCYRVRCGRADGDLVFWIDREDYTLRRIDYPIREFREQLASSGVEVQNLALWAEFHDARLNPALEPVAFQFEVPQETQRVARFNTYPPPTPPSRLMGKALRDFSFVDLDGSRVTRESLEGKVVIVDVWATWCQPCMHSLPNLNRVYQQYKDNPRVAFLAVSIDESTVPNEKLVEAFEGIQVDLPIVRDPDLHARDTFEVAGLPNLLLISPEGVLEDNEVGMNPQLAEVLPAKIDKLLAGESLYEEAMKRYEDEKARYEQSMQTAMTEAPAAGTTVDNAAETTPASEPSTLKLVPLWESTDVKEPGNILVLPGANGSPRLLVNEGWRSVAELDSQGKLIVRHELDIPETAVVSILRQGTTAAGETIFIGTATTQDQIHVFDAQWKRLWSYPPENEAEVADVQMADLDGDGTDEILVSFWSTRGVECLDLQGKRLWAYGELENVFRIAPWHDASGATHLLCAHSAGTLARLDTQGKYLNEIGVGHRFVRHFSAIEPPGEEAQLCALSPVSGGSDVLVGFTPTGAEQWAYDLPAGLHRQPIEMITRGQLFAGQPSHWIVAAADGSLHMIHDDGTLADRFNTGATLHGMATMQADGQRVLLLSTSQGIKAWNCSNP
jgi:thiol-disulfide isomerase/thioredoxin